MADPAVSVVIPTYQRAESLRRLLGALATCEAPPGGFEVIVVDDGSTDATSEVVAAAPLAVRLLRQPNAGSGTARNAGWRAARAPIVAFTDDDTVPSPRWLVELVAAVVPGVDGVGGAVVPLHEGFLATFVQLERLADHGRDPTGDVTWLVTANAAFRRSALEAVDGFDEAFPGAAGEDVDLSVRLLDAGHRLVLTPDAEVAHEHRTELVAILRTFRSHGRAGARLAALHPEHFRGSIRRGRTTSVRYWVDRHRMYRREGPAGPLAASAYVVLRAAGLLAYATGMLRAGRAAVSDAASGPPTVAIACSGLTHVQRGYESFTLELAAALRRSAAWDVVVVQGSGRPAPGSVRAPCLRRDGRIATALARVLPLRRGTFAYDVEQGTFALTLLLHLRRTRPDVLLASDVVTLKVLARLGRLVPRELRIVFSNGAPWPGPYPYADLVQHLTPAWQARAEPSDVATGRSRVLPYGMEPLDEVAVGEEARAIRRALDLPVDTCLVVSVGLLDRSHKRHDALIASVARLPEPRPHLLLLGQRGPETVELEALAASLLGDGGATFRTVAPRDVERHLRCADAFALLSTKEGFGRAYLEATSVGLPCVVHDFDVSRFVLGDHGCYVDATSTEQVAARLAEVLATGLSHEERAAQRERVEACFGWDALLPAYEALLEACRELPPRPVHP